MSPAEQLLIDMVVNDLAGSDVRDRVGSLSSQLAQALCQAENAADAEFPDPRLEKVRRVLRATRDPRRRRLSSSSPAVRLHKKLFGCELHESVYACEALVQELLCEGFLASLAD